MKNYLIIINPRAGNRNNARQITAIRKFYEASKVNHTIFFTSKERNAEVLVKENFDISYSTLIIAGGDGSVYEAINGLKHLNVSIGILPIGRGNDYVKNLDLGTSLNEQLINTLQDRTISVDVGLANGRRFLNGIGAGFDGQIVYNMHHSKSILKGHAAYYYHVIKILGSYREREIELLIDGKSYFENAILVIIGNGTTFGGGFKLLPDASVASDDFSICVIGKISPLLRFYYLNKLKKGLHHSIKGVKFYTGRNIEIVSGDIISQIDGEEFINPPITVEMQKEKINLIAQKAAV